MPRRYRLAFLVRRFRAMNLLEPELETMPNWLKFLGVHQRVAVDIGANFGLWTYYLANQFQKVIAIEPNPEVLLDLRSARFKNVDIKQCGVSRKNEIRTLHIPIVNGQIQAGWSSFDPRNNPSASATKAINVECRSVDELLQGYEIDFIKIDVEGAEIEVLKGATQVMDSSRPVIMIEIRDNNLNKIEEMVRCTGYKIVKLEDILGAKSSHENYFLVPINL